MKNNDAHPGTFEISLPSVCGICFSEKMLSSTNYIVFSKIEWKFVQMHTNNSSFHPGLPVIHL